MLFPLWRNLLIILRGIGIRRLCSIPSRLGMQNEFYGYYWPRSNMMTLWCGGVNTRGSSRSGVPINYYKKLYSLKLPTKIKITICKIANNYIPTFTNLNLQTLVINTVCPRCTEEQIWAGLNSLPRCLGRVIIILVGCLEEHYGQSELDGPTRMSANDQWIPTHGELIEVNFDEAFDKDCLQSCSRRVSRNAGGWVLVSRTILHENVASAFAVEALACSWAVQTSMEKGWSDLIFEGDSLSVESQSTFSYTNGIMFKKEGANLHGRWGFQIWQTENGR
ncbi:hypothetical protein GOBAR_DD10349 [Gossypium barbadense]|nr:hypothetical protein GOBAR_DD10349 [Gossypium barbadense]